MEKAKIQLLKQILKVKKEGLTVTDIQSILNHRITLNQIKKSLDDTHDTPPDTEHILTKASKE